MKLQDYKIIFDSSTVHRATKQGNRQCQMITDPWLWIIKLRLETFGFRGWEDRCGGRKKWTKTNIRTLAEGFRNFGGREVPVSEL